MIASIVQPGLPASLLGALAPAGGSGPKLPPGFAALLARLDFTTGAGEAPVTALDVKGKTEAEAVVQSDAEHDLGPVPDGLEEVAEALNAALSAVYAAAGRTLEPRAGQKSGDGPATIAEITRSPVAAFRVAQSSLMRAARAANLSTVALPVAATPPAQPAADGAVVPSAAIPNPAALVPQDAAVPEGLRADPVESAAPPLPAASAREPIASTVEPDTGGAPAAAPAAAPVIPADAPAEKPAIMLKPTRDAPAAKVALPARPGAKTPAPEAAPTMIATEAEPSAQPPVAVALPTSAATVSTSAPAESAPRAPSPATAPAPAPAPLPGIAAAPATTSTAVSDVADTTGRPATRRPAPAVPTMEAGPAPKPPKTGLVEDGDPLLPIAAAEARTADQAPQSAQPAQPGIAPAVPATPAHAAPLPAAVPPSAPDPSIAPAMTAAVVEAPVQPQSASEIVITHHLDLARDGEWLDRLARDIARSANHDAQLRFQLNPEHLGSLRVELANGADGAAIRFTAETEAARNILVDAQPRLIAEARAQGLRISEAQVDFGGHHGQQRGKEENPQTFVRTQQQREDSAARPPRSAAERYA